MATYWFKPKRYGYGATPATWQGWVFTLLLVVVGAGCALLVLAGLRHNAPAGVITAAVLWAVAIAVAVSVSRRKTEGGWRWRWGGE